MKMLNEYDDYFANTLELCLICPNPTICETSPEKQHNFNF